MNTDHIQREFDAYRRDEEAARAILDLAVSESRDTSAEEDERFEKLAESARAHKARADKLTEMAANAASLADAVRHQIGDQSDAGTGGTSSGPNDALLENIRRVQAEYRGMRNEVEFVTEMVVDLAKRAIADFSDNGSLYTTDFATQIAVYKRTLSPWIDLSSILNATNGRPLNVPKLTADNTTYKPGEGTAITESTPTLGSAALTTSAYKGLSYISAEAEDDELVGLLPVVARQQARSIGLSFGSDATTSILAAINNGGTATGLGGAGAANNALSTATFVGYEDLLDLKYGRAVPYRIAGVWVMSNGMIKKARKYRDGQGQYLWQPAIGVGQPATFDGNPVYEDPNLAAPASATKSVVFGDPSAALLIKQMPIRVAVSTDFKFDTDQVAIKSVYRAGIAVPDPAALAFLVSANT